MLNTRTYLQLARSIFMMHYTAPNKFLTNISFSHLEKIELPTSVLLTTLPVFPARWLYTNLIPVCLLHIQVSRARVAYFHRKQPQPPSQQSVMPHSKRQDCDDDQVATKGLVQFKSNEQGNTVRGGKSCGSRQVFRISKCLCKVVVLLATSSINVRSVSATHWLGLGLSLCFSNFESFTASWRFITLSFSETTYSVSYIVYALSLYSTLDDNWVSTRCEGTELIIKASSLRIQYGKVTDSSTHELRRAILDRSRHEIRSHLWP